MAAARCLRFSAWEELLFSGCIM